MMTLAKILSFAEPGLKLIIRSLFKLIALENGFIYTMLLSLLIFFFENVLYSFIFRVFCLIALVGTILLVLFPREVKQKKSETSTGKADSSATATLKRIENEIIASSNSSSPGRVLKFKIETTNPDKPIGFKEKCSLVKRKIISFLKKPHETIEKLISKHNKKRLLKDRFQYDFSTGPGSSKLKFQLELKYAYFCIFVFLCLIYPHIQLSVVHPKPTETTLSSYGLFYSWIMYYFNPSFLSFWPFSNQAIEQKSTSSTILSWTIQQLLAPLFFKSWWIFWRYLTIPLINIILQFILKTLFFSF